MFVVIAFSQPSTSSNVTIFTRGHKSWETATKHWKLKGKRNSMLSSLQKRHRKLKLGLPQKMTEPEKKGPLTTLLICQKSSASRSWEHFTFGVPRCICCTAEIWVSPNLFQLAPGHYLDPIEGESTFIKMNKDTSSWCDLGGCTVAG